MLSPILVLALVLLPVVAGYVLSLVEDRMLDRAALRGATAGPTAVNPYPAGSDRWHIWNLYRDGIAILSR